MGIEVGCHEFPEELSRRGETVGSAGRTFVGKQRKLFEGVHQFQDSAFDLVPDLPELG